jgi:Zn-dependent protease with chaperone function
MSFEATALSSQFPRGRKSGTLEVINGVLCFKDTAGTISGLPLQGSSITPGGAGNRYIYFTHPAYPDLTFYTDDHGILKLPEIKFDQHHAPVGRSIRNDKRVTMGVLYTVLGLIVACIVSLFVFRGLIVEHIAGMLPPAKEQEVAAHMRASAIAGKKIVTDTSIQRRLDMITQPLVNAVDDKEFKFSFTIIEDETLNAFALPGGAVIIHSGLIEKAKSADEVAGVLAHEISHVTRRHHLRGIIGNLGLYVVASAFFGDLTGISAAVTNAGMSLGSLKYSRDFEYEADKSGMELLDKADINPDGMIRFFETMKKEHGDMGLSDFMSTHPATGERIEKLRKTKVKHDTFIAFPFNFDQFKKDIDTYFKNKNSSWK